MAGPRVLFVSHAGAMSGAELVLLDLVRAWPNASAFLFEDGPLAAALEGAGIGVERARRGAGLGRLRRGSSPLRALPLAGRLASLGFELAGAMRRHELVYANSQKAFTVAATAGIAARRPLIWHLHDILDASHFGSAQRRLQVGLANLRAARVIVPSAAAADAFVAAGGRRSLIEVVPNGVSVTLDPRPKAALRQALGLPSGPLIGVFSRLAPWKGQHVLIEALASLPDVACAIAGAPLFGEEAYADRLRTRTAELGLEGRIHFLGQRNDVPRLMQAVDAVVHPSVAPEPFGLTLVEAMLAGTPVIATDAGASADILDGGRAGTLVPPGAAAPLAAAVRGVLAGQPALAGRTAYAAERARSRFGAARMRQDVAALVGRVTAEAAA